ncbi:MAG: pyridoxamine 5'-phosphate oxidase family protein [Candidatus Bathyarchaeia archaeon]
MKEVKLTRKILRDMNDAEVDQFLACARVGRVGISVEDGPYVVPVGYAYSNGEIFHSCYQGLKMDGMRRNPRVCFEVDESLSDASMFKSVIVRGDIGFVDKT